MKIMIASDIHGSAYYLEQLLNRYDEENPDKLLLLGDILYHGPRNDLPKGYAPKDVILLLNTHKFSVCVATAIPKLTRWFWIFQSLQTTAFYMKKDT